MRTILQKHTSKFAAGLFNSLGIIACVSVTACDNKGKQTGAQVEKVKNDLKKKYTKLEDDDAEKIAKLVDCKSLKSEDAEKIADFLSKNKKSINELTKDDLKTIFNDTAKVNEVVSKLGIKPTVSNLDDEEKKKKINEWLVKLKGFKNTNFDNLDNDLKEKVVQKFIDSKVSINNNSEISAKLGDFVNKVLKEKEESKVVLKVEGEGQVSITSVVSQEVKKFVFNKIEDFQSFVSALKGKEITTVDNNWSLKFEGGNIKVCEHKTGFDITGCFGTFLNCLNTLVGFKKFNIPNLSLKIEGGNLSLNKVDCTAEYFKKDEFWKLVKDNVSLFSIGDKNKFKIEKNGDGGSATVKIGDLVTLLKWSDVVESGDKEFVVDSGWGEIFELGQVSVESNPSSSEENEETEKKTFKWGNNGTYSLGEDEAVSITLENLKELVGTLNGKNCKIVCSDEDKAKFKIVFENKNVKICDHSTGFTVLDSVDNFKGFLDCIKDLKGKEVIKEDFKIEIAIVSNKLQLGGVDIEGCDFVNGANFWSVVKIYKNLFNSLPLKNVKVDSSTKGKIGEFGLNFDVFGGGDSSQIIDNWNEIFSVEES